MADLTITILTPLGQRVINYLPPTGDAADADSLPMVFSAGSKLLIGTTNEAAPATDVAAAGLNGLMKRNNAHLTTLQGRFPATLGRKEHGAGVGVSLSNQDYAALQALAAINPDMAALLERIADSNETMRDEEMEFLPPTEPMTDTTKILTRTTLNVTGAAGYTPLLIPDAGKRHYTYELFLQTDIATEVRFYSNDTAFDQPVRLKADGELRVPYNHDPEFVTDVGHAFRIWKSNAAVLTGRMKTRTV